MESNCLNYVIKTVKQIDFIAYAGRDKDRQGSVAESIVKRSMNGLLNCSRKLFADNFYTFILLAKTLIARNTHYVRTLQKKLYWNSKGNCHNL